MTEAFVLFPYGTGTNTKLHSIRGLGYKIYPFEQQINRSVSRLIDQGELASSLVLQGETESDYANMGLEYIGNSGGVATKLESRQCPHARPFSVSHACHRIDAVLGQRANSRLLAR